MSGNVYFNPSPSRSQLFIPILIPAPTFSEVSFPFPSQSHRLFPFPPAAIPILVSHRICCCFSCASWNKITSKLTRNGSTLYFCIKNNWNHTNVQTGL